MLKTVFIIARERRDLYDSLRRTFAKDSAIQVRLDRRAPKQSADKTHPQAPRAGERRVRPEAGQFQLRERGWTVVNVSIVAATVDNLL